MLIEEIIIYGSSFILVLLVLGVYLWIKSVKSKKNEAKIEKAKVEGVHEPVSLYPFIDPDLCIGGAACVAACPEKDIIGVVNGRGVLINASSCVGHGACFHACPVEAISLKIGTEKRGVDLPHINQNFETNVEGIFIAGELGGMGLIKNSVEQGKQAIDNLAKSIEPNHNCNYDVVIVGAGPAGISGSVQAKLLGLKTLTLEQDSLGGTVFSFPRAKIVMTNPMELPGYGNLKLIETSKSELLKIWTDLIQKHSINLKEHSKVNEISTIQNGFEIKLDSGDVITSLKVLLAIGRRGTPRKLNVPGETLEKVAYRLLEPELIQGKNIVVIGGGDSAIESAILLAANNQVILSYRSDKFNRLKPKNASNIQQAFETGLVVPLLNSIVQEIFVDKISFNQDGKIVEFKNDLVYIFAGGELPTEFLQKAGIEITKRFGYTLKSRK